MTFDIHGIEELNRLTDKLRQIDGVIDIEKDCGIVVPEFFCVSDIENHS